MVMPDAFFGAAAGRRSHRRRQLLRLGATLHGAADLRRVDFAFADRAIQLLGVVEIELADQLRQRHRMNRQTLQFAFEDLSTLLRF